MLKINKKTLKVVAEVTSVILVAVCVNAAFNKCIPDEYTNKIVVRVGKAIITYAAMVASVDSVDKLLGD